MHYLNNSNKFMLPPTRCPNCDLPTRPVTLTEYGLCTQCYALAVFTPTIMERAKQVHDALNKK